MKPHIFAIVCPIVSVTIGYASMELTVRAAFFARGRHVLTQGRRHRASRANKEPKARLVDDTTDDL